MKRLISLLGVIAAVVATFTVSEGVTAQGLGIPPVPTIAPQLPQPVPTVRLQSPQAPTVVIVPPTAVPRIEPTRVPIPTVGPPTTADGIGCKWRRSRARRPHWRFSD